MQHKVENLESPWYSFVTDCSAHNSTLGDEACLEAMRDIIKEYSARRQLNQINETIREAFKQRFETYRQMMRNDAMRAYTAFEFMEKLYWQEYLVKE